MKHVSRADYGRVMEAWPTSGAKMPVLYITDTKDIRHCTGIAETEKATYQGTGKADLEFVVGA